MTAEPIDILIANIAALQIEVHAIDHNIRAEFARRKEESDTAFNQAMSRVTTEFRDVQAKMLDRYVSHAERLAVIETERRMEHLDEERRMAAISRRTGIVAVAVSAAMWVGTQAIAWVKHL